MADHLTAADLYDPETDTGLCYNRELCRFEMRDSGHARYWVADYLVAGWEDPIETLAKCLSTVWSLTSWAVLRRWAELLWDHRG